MRPTHRSPRWSAVSFGSYASRDAIAGGDAAVVKGFAVALVHRDDPVSNIAGSTLVAKGPKPDRLRRRLGSSPFFAIVTITEIDPTLICSRSTYPGVRDIESGPVDPDAFFAFLGLRPLSRFTRIRTSRIRLVSALGR
jgi:hypothetical protein